MLTLKVLTTDINGNQTSHLFSGDSIIHKEYFSEDHHLASKVREKNSDIWIIGEMTETSSTQKFTASDVFVYDEERYAKHVLFITPKAECYIMENGKTIDSFFCQFEQ